MKTSSLRPFAISLLLLGTPVLVQAQSPLKLASQAYQNCVFTRGCNWSSHAIIAFGTTFALKGLGVPTSAAASAAALFYVGKEFRDHIKWGVLGSADSNGDMLSGIVGALVAHHLIRPLAGKSEAGVGLEFRDRAWLTISLRSP